jgi:hypothetical protein
MEGLPLKNEHSPTRIESQQDVVLGLLLGVERSIV